jgi:hypothetical protein
VTRRFALVPLLLLLAATAAEAQSQVARQQKPKRPKEFTVMGILIGPSTLGESSASLIRPDGSPLVVFAATHRIAPGYGLESALGFQIKKGLWAEASGSWALSELQSRVSNDVEGATAATLTESVMRFSVEGSALVYFHETARTGVFARGGAGWMRELTGSSSLALDGMMGNAGIGVKHLVRDKPKGGFRRVGFRAEFRVNFRSTSLTPLAPAKRIAPSAAGGLVIGF